jgi:predicted peptidase
MNARLPAVWGQWLLMVAAFFSWNTVFADDDDTFEGHTFCRVVEQKLPYRLLKPLNYDPQKKYPIVLFLHGAGESGTNNRSQLCYVVRTFYAQENREKYPCFVVAPQTANGWGDRGGNGNEGIQSMLLQLMQNLEKEFSIDPQRRYVIGLSMGGFGTWGLIARYPDMFAAAVPICGGGNPDTAAAIAKIPIWAFHGALDDVVSVQFTQRMIEAVKQAGGEPRYTEYPDCKHDSWELAVKDPDLLSWLFAQKRAD